MAIIAAPAPWTAVGLQVVDANQEPVCYVERNARHRTGCVRVIAAAPELAAASADFLEWFKEFMGHDYAEIDCPALTAFKMALAKAGV